MKTNEEILRHHLTSDQLEWLDEDARNLNFILDAMNEAQRQVNSVDLADVVLSEERAELVCGECKEVKKLEYCEDCYNEACGAM
jgi:hypothetical protein